MDNRSITFNIKNISKNLIIFPDPELGEKGSAAFLDACVHPLKADVQNIKIDLTAIKPKYYDFVNTNNMRLSRSLSYKISKQDILIIYQQIKSFCENPALIAKYLQDIESELSLLLTKYDISFKQNLNPDTLIAGLGQFIPGPPSDTYIPLHKQKLLDTLLLKEENLLSNRQQKSVLKFIGYVEKNVARHFISNGLLFGEQQQITRALLHGTYSHRLLFHAINNAIKNKSIILKNGEAEISSKQLLELLVKVEFKIDSENNYSLWQLLLDSGPSPDMISDLDFDSSSPFTFNSLLLCFGEALNLPTLQNYLLDNFYKEAFKMVIRAIEFIARETGKEINDHGLREDYLFELCMHYASTVTKNTGEIEQDTPFTLTADDVSQHYMKVEEGVYERIKPIHPAGSYRSLAEFFIFHSQGKITKFNYVNNDSVKLVENSELKKKN